MFNRLCILLLVGLLPLVWQSADADQPDRVDCSTLTGKVMCGYQGWFNCDGDGMGLGWTHWAHDRRKILAPGNATIDLWPDVSEYDADERFATGFKLADGSVAEVFSSAKGKTVLRHFRWMRQYGIDGVFVQRFGNGLRRGATLRHKNTVLFHSRDGAEQYGRAFAVMYDLSGMKAGTLDQVRDDWRKLRSDQKINQSDCYLHHNGKPLVAIWGIGFNDRHKGGQYSLRDCEKLVTDLKAEGCSIMLGVPTGWRELNRDCVDDQHVHVILKMADIISPWTPGRYRNPREAARHGEKLWKRDLEWCSAEQLDYLPVVFPGFSWHNLKRGASPLGQIPRLKGRFLWSQIVAAKRIGASMIYVAMFDEVDEGTAIFKCTNSPPVGAGARFLTYEGLPSDHYLKLVGHAAKVLRDQAPATDEMPTLSPLSAE